MAENIIYCYSGGGNCLDMAKNIARELGDTDIVMMRSAPVKTDAREAKRVGFIFPCYGGGLPGKVEEYAKTILISPDAYTFGIVQYAGYMGCGLYKLDRIRELDYWAGMSHQCTCIWLMPHGLMNPPLSVAAAQKRSEASQRSMQAVISASATARSGEVEVSAQAASSSRARAASPPPRFWREASRSALMARFRVMRPRNARRLRGRSGGMAPHRRKRASLTHSSASRASASILSATARQYAPYLSCAAGIAASSRAQNRLIIVASSMRLLLSKGPSLL